MLQNIRDHTQGWIAGVIISLLILSFALWGIHSYIGGSGVNDVIAKVNGIEITKGQLSITYERMKRQLQSQMNVPQLPIQAESAIKERALQSLIDTQVLKQAAIDSGYRISLIQSESFLQSLPEFQENGKFSTVKFQTLLQANLFNASGFIDLIKTTLLIDQPRLGIILTSSILPTEIENVVALVNQERNLEYAILKTDIIKKQFIAIPDSQIKAYYDQHQDLFKTSEKIIIDYIPLNFADIVSTIKPTQEALKQFYNETSSSYSTKEGTADNKASAPKTETTIPSFEMVKDKVEKAYIQQHAEEKFSELREKLANITYEHPDSLDVAAKELGLKVITSDSFTRDHGGKDLMGNPKIREAAFSNEVLTQRNNSDLIQVNSETAVVLRVKNYFPAKVLSLDVVKQQIIDKLTLAEQELKLKQLALEIKQKLVDGASAKQIATQYSLDWQKAGYVTRHVKSVESSILETAFALPKPSQANPVYGLAKSKDSYAIIAINHYRNGTIKPNDKEYKVFAEQIQNAQGLVEYELYKARLLKEAHIKIEE